MLISFKQRAEEQELIDDFSLSGPEVERTFKSIEGVNAWLGGNQVFVSGFKKILQHPSFLDRQAPLGVHDLGCGSGDGLHALAGWLRSKKISAQLQGYDANPFVVELARKQNEGYSEVSIEEQDIFADDYLPATAEVISFNLCLHHFSEDTYLPLLKKCKNAGVKAILINDLHRNWLAYRLFQLVSWAFRLPKMAKEDGLLSVRKGFTRKELTQMAEKLDLPDYHLAWKWAFRYQFILFIPPSNNS